MSIADKRPGVPRGATRKRTDTMHEANAVRTAIRNAVTERAATQADAPETHPDASHAYHHLELDIVDPTRASAAAVQLYAPPILDELGLRTVSFDVFVRAVRCSLCGHLTRAEPHDPVCRSCGGPVPRTDGAAIEARWTRPIAMPTDPGPVHDVGSHLADHRRHVARVLR